MFGVFYLIFSLASVPMDLLDALFGRSGGLGVFDVAPGRSRAEPDCRRRRSQGVGSVLVFLPQICILFLIIALLEDSGYLARAALVMDRLMRRVSACRARRSFPCCRPMPARCRRSCRRV